MIAAEARAHPARNFQMGIRIENPKLGVFERFVFLKKAEQGFSFSAEAENCDFCHELWSNDAHI